MPREKPRLYALLRNSSIEEWEKYRHNKITCPDLCHVLKDYATKTSPKVRINGKKLYKSRTTLRNNSKGRQRCKKYVQVDRILHGTFDEKKQYVSESTLALC